MTNNVYLNTAFAFMACDGEIVPEEIAFIKQMANDKVFTVDNIDQYIENLINQLNTEGKHFLRSYLLSLDDFVLTRDEALKLLKIAVNTIFVDDDYKYSEVKFFRATRLHLKTIDDDDILNNIPEIDDFWLEPDIETDNIEKDYFDSVEIPFFDLTTIK